MKKLLLRFFALLLFFSFFHGCDSPVDPLKEEQTSQRMATKPAQVEIIAEDMLKKADAGERFFVLFSDQADPETVAQAGGEVIRSYHIVPAVLATGSADVVSDLAAHPEVIRIEPDSPVHAHGQTVPWGIDRVFGDEEYSFDTWKTTKGQGIAVAILDTGIDEDHEDLPELSGGKNTIDDTHWGSDGSGHGTHVAGTVSALDNDLGVVGVGPEIGLYAVKVLDDGGSGTVSSVVGGIEWAVDEGIPVLNMSLGSSSDSQTLREACDAAFKNGHLLVASAGNSGNPAGRGDNVGYPAAYESVIAVAASTENDNRASYSSTGPAVELIAPGSNIESTVPGDGYDTKSGTSMAAPHVTGVAALAWSDNTGLLNSDIREILQDTAEDLGMSENHQGHGLVRADRAVRAAADKEPVATGNIEGTVKDKDAAIKGATVEVEGTDLSATTDADGYYLLEEVPDGEQKVTASADGYYSETATVTVEGDKTVTQDFTLKAISTYTVSGTVTDAEGNGLGGATVTIEVTGQEATTGNDGTYSISDVEGDTYDITASKDGYSRETKNVTVESDTTVDFSLDEEVEVQLSIDIFELTDSSNPAWARVTVDWAVSGSNLASVKSEMILDGEVVDSETSSVSGSEASGTHELRNRGGHGETYEVTLTVTDVDGNSSFETKQIEL